MIARWLVFAAGAVLALADCPLPGTLPNPNIPYNFYVSTLKGLPTPETGNITGTGGAHVTNQTCSIVFFGPEERDYYEVTTQTGHVDNGAFPGFVISCYDKGLLADVGASLGRDYTTPVTSWVSQDSRQAYVFVGRPQSRKFVKLYFTCIYFVSIF